MKDKIVIAGGSRKRNNELASKFNPEQWKITICQSSIDLISASMEDGIASIILLYPDKYEIINELFHSSALSRPACKAPVIFISASPDDNDHLRYSRYEADEFLIEPISASELLRTIHGLLTDQNERRKILAIGDIVLDRTSLTATLRNAKLPLHPVQVRLLEFLMLNPGHAFTRQQIANSIWNLGDSIEERTIDVIVARIRDALRHKVTMDPIRTVRSVGYAFDEYFAQVSSMPKKGRLGARRVR